MEFKELIYKYMELLDCTAHDISLASGLSDSTISRYRSGERIPSPTSEEFESLVSGFEMLFEVSDSDKKTADIRSELMSVIPVSSINSQLFSKRLSTLVELLGINRSKLASKTGYDASFITRVINNQRTPSDYMSFAHKISCYAASVSDSPEIIGHLSALMDVDPTLLDTEEKREDHIADWLLDIEHDSGAESAEKTDREVIGSFLSKLDEFDLNDYMKRVKFEKIKVVTSPLKPYGSKHYSGVRGMKKAEIEFMRRTVLSSSKAPVWEYSDLPIEDLASDVRFSKSWMIGLAMMLKKGHRLNIIHDVRRPFEEMMLGLESWIPLYMTGLISPYYLESSTDGDFSHMLRLSETCALIGECSEKDLSTALFFLSSNPSDIDASKKRRDTLFASALPLMEIYREDSFDKFNKLCKEEEKLLNKKTGKAPEALPDDRNLFFKNINLVRYGDELVIISKMNKPEIHFVIRESRLKDAIISLWD